MSSVTPTSQNAVARLLKQILSDRGLTAKELSLKLGQNRDYIAARLREEAQITLDFLDRVCDALEFPIMDVFARIYPFDAGAAPPSESSNLSARQLLERIDVGGEVAYGPERLAQLVLRARMSKGDGLERATPDDFPVTLIRDAEPIIQRSVSKAINYYLYWLDDCLSYPPGSAERAIKFPALLSSLAVLLVNKRTDMVSIGRHLLLFALEMSELSDAPVLNAYLDERASVLLWHFGHKEQAIDLLERPSYVHHPMLDSYFNYLGTFHYLGFGNFAEALACFDLVLVHTKSKYVAYSAIQHRALILAETESYESAAAELQEAQELGLPTKLEWHVEFTRARLYRISGDKEAALRSLLELLADDRLPADDSEQMAFFFIEFFMVSPPHDVVAPLFRRIEAVSNSLDPSLPHQRAMREPLEDGLRRFALASPSNTTRSNVVPNS